MKNKRETIQKTIILEKTRRLANHPTAEEIYRAVRADFPRVSMGTVYRNLNRLAGEGKIKKIEIPNAADRFDHQTHFHHHLKCEECGGVYDVEMKTGDSVLESVINRDDFVIKSYQIIFYGACQKCHKKHKEDI
ncbi:MAG: transcriptional repressor [Bacilli bacterium]|jgi:Fe2+ or Zn2+ uptake regulation protein|nr:transcriptional repressor [Bacillota bacterium]NLM31477.1 transcriptional repressor [Acholeplasmataceae bacterium]HOA78892.1 transcriptional repressor [Bacilli bacterium]HPZ27564.1 transcriptional repressor [Bacilli bacterium]HQC89975.1 transcriptional repressor [Bacilli bacterium]